ncbi:MAG: hypothetical protein QG657_1238, partial [Acidobacteriota bacterium]|nr:hypothetical protein [Acidobacteriota bacterium]
MIKVKNIQGILSLLLAAAFFLGIASALLTLPLYGVSGIYDRIGIIPEHGLHGAVPEEN